MGVWELTNILFKNISAFSISSFVNPVNAVCAVFATVSVAFSFISLNIVVNLSKTASQLLVGIVKSENTLSKLFLVPFNNLSVKASCSASVFLIISCRF